VSIETWMGSDLVKYHCNLVEKTNKSGRVSARKEVSWTIEITYWI